MRRGLGAGLAVLLLALAPAAGRAAPVQALHRVVWHVHVDLLAPLGRDLAFYRNLLETRIAEAGVLLEGSQGPPDTACCTALQLASITSFGTPGDGLDAITSQAELLEISQRFGPGGYLVQSIFCCGCTTPGAAVLGCAPTPGDFFVVALDAEDRDATAQVIAHERGHNAGLAHVSGDPCRLMAAANGGGCLTPLECTTYAAKADASGRSCACLPDTVGDPPLADGSVCSDASGCGLCSGGVCGPCDGEASLQLVAAGGPELPTTALTDDAIVHSPVSGGWQVPGPVGQGLEITGAAYAPPRGVLYAVAREAARANRLVTLDPATGQLDRVLGFLVGHANVQALAYDPGPSGGPDRLLAMESDNEIFGRRFDCVTAPTCFSSLLEIDPDTLQVRMLGELDPAALVAPGGVVGLAYDPLHGLLFGSSALGLHRIDPACPGGVCSVQPVDVLAPVPSALAFDPAGGRLYRMGTHQSVARLDTLDPLSGTRLRVLPIAAYTAGALAAVPLPEPSTAASVAALALGLGLLARRRRPGA